MPSHSQRGGRGRGVKDRSPKPDSLQRSQRQLRAGELVRHALAEILREEPFHDPALAGASVTVTEARVSPDLRHATVFVEPLGGRNAEDVVAALNRSARYIRGVLGRSIEMRFTPDLRFVHDETFAASAVMNRLFDNPVVQRDLRASETPDDDGAD